MQTISSDTIDADEFLVSTVDRNSSHAREIDFENAMDAKISWLKNSNIWEVTKKNDVLANGIVLSS